VTAKKNTTTKKKPTTKKSAKRKTAKKTDMVTTPNRASVAKFIDAVENDARRKDAKTLLALMKKLTGDKPVMWGPSIIGFGQYHYKYASGREGDFMLVGFSPRKANMVLYVLGSLKDDDPLLGKLGKYKRGRACLYVNKLDDVDMDVLAKLITKSYNNTKNYWKA
jgi:hypothetical protein